MNESYEVAANDEGDLRPLIHEIRGVQVILDRDIANLYQVETKALNQAVKRNIGRFPEGFMFQLSKEECQCLRSQFVTSKRGGLRYRPYAFTEHGVVMLASILALLSTTSARSVSLARLSTLPLSRKSWRNYDIGF